MSAKDVPATRAWLMMGMTGSAPGVLQIADGRLRYTVHGRGALTGGQLGRLEERSGRPGLADELGDGARVTLLDVPVEKVGGVTFPWYYFGAGMKLAVGGVRYRFSFIKPQNTQDEPGIMAVPGSRATGRTWRAALGAAS
jgi:hypothetical protein